MSLILSGTDGLSDVDGSAATPAIRGTDANTGIFFPAADTIAFAEGGAEVARFDSSGNFGLGVTPSAWSGAKALEMGGGSNASYIAFNNTGTLQSYLYWNAFYNGTNNIYKATGRSNVYGVNASGEFVWFNAASGTAGNTITFTQAMTLNTNGVLALQGASTSANGVGITFPATQSASSNANTLDDYEEGTWTPTLGGTSTYSIQAGTYVKVGKVVTAWFDISISAMGTGRTNASITTLPFASRASSYPQGMAGSVGYFASLNLSVYAVFVRVDNNSTTAQLACTTAASATVVDGPNLFTAGSRITGTVTYETD